MLFNISVSMKIKWPEKALFMSESIKFIKDYGKENCTRKRMTQNIDELNISNFPVVLLKSLEIL